MKSRSRADSTRHRLAWILPVFVVVLVVAVTSLVFLNRTRPATSGGDAVTSTVTLPAPKDLNVDVLIYGTQTSGLAALHELEVNLPLLRVALVSGQKPLETPLVQGLCVEDRYATTPVMGFYKEWRNRVIAEYQTGGRNVLAPGGRLSYEPEVAKRALESLIGGSESRVFVVTGQLLSATDSGNKRNAVFKSDAGELTRVNAEYFIDASVEADLARMLGADYRIGSGETIYNDVLGRVPAAPSQQNDFVTAPQKLTALLTLEVFSAGPAPSVSVLVNPDYDPTTYDPAATSTAGLSARFGSSWTMKIAVLPDAKRELNEPWNDWPDPQAAFAWVLHPEERKLIYRKALTRSLNLVRYLQENGFPHIGIAQIPDLPYVREGPRVVGVATYTETELVQGVSDKSIAVGLYAQFDRHQNIAPTFIDTPTTVHVPMGAIMPAGHPWLLVTTAVSADYQAYCSAVRMEPTRANIGGAAGIITALALRRGESPEALDYQEVRSELVSRGYAIN